jgi:hypothetical protein
MLAGSPDDIVAVRWAARGTSRSSLQSLPATRDPVEITGVSMYRVPGDEIAGIRDTRETLSVMQRLDPGLMAASRRQ